MATPCIYCLSDASTSTQEYHVLPYAAGNTQERRRMLGELVLPPGVVCDRCNQYFGAKLEPHLTNHPVIQLWRTLHGVGGRKGKAIIYQTESLKLSNLKPNLLVVDVGEDQFKIGRDGLVKIPHPSVWPENVQRALGPYKK